MTIPEVKIPRYTPMHEMTAIKGGKAQGMTHAEIKKYIDQGRKMRGTYRGQGISTNTISRLLGKTHSKKYTKKIEHAWEVHAKQTHQVSQMEKVRSRIKDPKERAKFDKFARRIIRRTEGKQYNLEVDYIAEDDTYYAYSP